MTRLWLIMVLALLGGAPLVVGCGEEPEPDQPAVLSQEEPADTAVEAREGNVVTIDGLRYRVILFRQLNPNIPPDQALYEGPAPEPGRGIYSAFVEVCNESSEPRRVIGDVHLEDAFGEVFLPLSRRVPDRYEYRPVELVPEACLPARNTITAQTFVGAALVFEVPFDSIRERPMILELQGEAGTAPRRIELDV